MKVYLNKGLVDIRLAPGNKATIAEIRKAIRNDAFTPKSATVSAVGKLVSKGGKLRFKVAGTNETFPVVSTSHQSWQKDVGQEVTVNGLLGVPVNGTEGGTLQITSVSASSPVKE